MARFANCNDFPVVLGNPRGGSDYLRAGEFRDGDWWSRFAQPKTRDSAGGQLTKVADDWTPTRDFIPRVDKRTINQLRAPVIVPTMGTGGCQLGCETVCQVTCESACQVACESNEQTIVVHEHYEQVGPEFYCAYCDWSTKDEQHVAQHLQSYHSDKVGHVDVPVPAPAPVPVPKVSRTEEVGSPGSAPPAEDPGQNGERGTVPTQDSPSPGPKDTPGGNGFWEQRGGKFHCTICHVVEPHRPPWSTTNKGAMVRHAIRAHKYERAAAGV